MSIRPGPRIQVGRHHGHGNKMFRYAYAHALQALIPGSVVTGYHVPLFGLCAEVESLQGRVLHIPHGHRHSLQAVASLVNRGVYDHVQLDGFVQRLEFYPDREAFSALFPPPTSVAPSFVGPEHVVVNVRAAEVIGNVHPDYGPVPVAYFKQVAESTGLKPVIMGQLGNDGYSDAIRHCFGSCTILPSRSPVEDFQILRSAANVVIGVSTFSWLACWMSNTAQVIHMPLKGLFNPLQRPDVDLLPVGDPRYHFHSFPLERWESSDAQRKALVSAENPGLPISHAQARQMISYSFC